MNMYLLLKKAGLALAESFRAFRTTPSPRLMMTLLVKNEEDMLEDNLLFHKAMGVDGFIVTDNNSTDRTPDIICKYLRKGWIKEAILEKGSGYRQKQWVDRMIWKAKTVYKADWVINADADELWHSPSGNLKDELSATRCNVLKCEVRNVYPEEGKPFRRWNRTVKPVSLPELYGLPRYSLFDRQYGKVIHRTAGYLQIAMGNHKVAIFPRRSARAKVVIYHYNIRGKRHFMQKMINGGEQLEQNSNRNGGSHWRHFYRLYREGMLEEEYGRVIGTPAFDRLCRDGFIREDNTIPDFFRLHADGQPESHETD